MFMNTTKLTTLQGKIISQDKDALGFRWHAFWFSSLHANPSVNNSAVHMKRNLIFEEEKVRQKKLVPRIEKIEVKYFGQPENTTLIMNKNLSTPYNCSMHMSEMLTKRSVVALVNGKPWDMHRPIEEDCELQLLHFREIDPTVANKTFWRSCSLLLGMVAEKLFKDQYFVEPHSWPAVNVRSGSFVYDIDLHMGEWKPRQDELRAMTLLMRKITYQDLVIERLDIDSALALELFQDNKYKCRQIPQICEKTDSSSVTVYRVGKEYYDISKGPMMANTNQIGNCAIASVHLHQREDVLLHRFQGIAVPDTLPVCVI
ncbi:39S ribosomal protein L39, mitochondrial [Nymphon striatum]|nr:39S ribosomal protein L39, mitochondrial [Nymphon striatum]